MKNSSDSVVSKSAGNKLKVYVIKHDMGENWSLYHETIIKSIFFRPFTEINTDYHDRINIYIRV